MAEVLGVASAISGLLSLSGSILSQGYSFINSVHKAPRELRELLSETAALNTVIDRLQSLAEDDTLRGGNSALQGLAKGGGIQDCFELLRSVQRSIARCEQIKGQELRNLGRSMIWPFKEKETKDTLTRLSRMRDHLATAVSVDMIGMLRGVQRTGEGTSNEVSELRITAERQREAGNTRELMQWLDPDGTNLSERLAALLQEHHPGTGDWLIGSDVFRQLMMEGRALMWIFGIPGSGKTVLAAHLTNQLMEGQFERSHAVIYFFCDHANATTQNFRTFLTVSILQLLERNPDSINEVRKLYDKYKNNPRSVPSTKDMLQLLQDVIQYFEHTKIVVDALDECDDVEEFVGAFKSLISLGEGMKKLAIIVTSRNDLRVERSLGAIASFRVQMEDYVTADIGSFILGQVEYRIKSKSLKIRNPDLKFEIISALTNRAAGMFLWAKLQLDLISRLTNDKDIREALSRLPQSLNDTYIRLLRQTATVNAENIEEVRLIIVWLVGSREPLTVKQLAEAIAINPTVKFRDVDRIATDPEDLIANLGSLVITSHIEEDVVIGLAHFTLFDFLRSDAVRDDKSIAMFHMTDVEVHSVIAKACMHYLSYSDFELPCEAEQDSDMALQDRIKSYKLLRYAAFFWPKHLRAALVQSDLTFDDFAPYLVWFTNQGLQNGLFTSWLQVFHNSTVNSEDEQPLYYAIKFALWQVFKNGLTPLQLAAAKYSQPVLRTILQYGPRVDQKSMPRGLTALHFAAEYGRTLAVRILLEAGASPHERSSSGSTPFYRAARSGSLDTLTALYEAGSDVNAATWDNWTPIFEAIECHHLRVVTRLIAWGADLAVRINSRSKPTPLEFARIYGRPDMESILGLACQGFPGIADIAESSSLDLPAGDLDDGPSDCGIEILED